MIYGNSIPKKPVVVDEAYFGKSKDLLAIEYQIHQVRNKFMKSSKYFGNFNGDPEVIKLNRLFEKAFNINCFSMNFNRSNIMNAYTVPVACKYDTGQAFNPEKLKQITYVDQNGFKFDKKSKLCVICNINTGLIFSPKFSDGEILAIILHELGHNFAEAIDPRVAVNSMVLTYVQIILDIINWTNGQISLNSISPQMFNTLGKIEKQLREYMYANCKPLVSIFNVGKGLLGFAQDGLLNISYLVSTVNPFMGLGQAMLTKLVGLIIKPTAYRNEKIADRFATMHGYGTELTSALSKLEDGGQGITVKEIMNDIPVVGGLFNLAPSMIAIVVGAFDEHPIWPERLEDQIRALEYELNSSSLDPKMKKEIQDQIKSIKALEQKIIKDSEKNSIATDANWMKKWWFSMFAEGDLKHTLVGDMNKDIDSAVQKLKIKEGYEMTGFGRRKFDFM